MTTTEMDPGLVKQDQAKHLLSMLFETAGRFSAAIPKSKSLAADANAFYAELITALEDFQEVIAPINGAWLSADECNEYEETKKKIAQYEKAGYDADKARLTTITLLRWILDGNADATLRTAIEKFVESLGAEWEVRTLPNDPHLHLRLIG